MIRKAEGHWFDRNINSNIGSDGSNQKSHCVNRLNTWFGGYTKGDAPSSVEKTEIPRQKEQSVDWSDLCDQPYPIKLRMDDHLRLIFVADMSEAINFPVSFEHLRDEIVKNKKRRCWGWLIKDASVRLYQFVTSQAICLCLGF